MKRKKISDLNDIENVDVVLNEEDIKLLNRIFNELDTFEQITDHLELAISDNEINHAQLHQLYKIITKTVYFKTSLNRNVKRKKSIIKIFFELPEIISKKFYSFLYQDRYST